MIWLVLTLPFFFSFFFWPLCVSGCVCLHVWTQFGVRTLAVWLGVCVWDGQSRANLKFDWSLYQKWLLLLLGGGNESPTALPLPDGCITCHRALSSRAVMFLATWYCCHNALRILFRHSVHHPVHQKAHLEPRTCTVHFPWRHIHSCRCVFTLEARGTFKVV